MFQVTVFPEDIRAVDRAVRALEAEKALLDSWSAHSVELALVVDDLDALRSRMRAGEQEQRSRLAAHTAFPLRSVS